MAGLVGGGQVTFTCSGKIVVPVIGITRDTVIDTTGHTVTLSGNNVNPVFYVDAVRLDLIGLTVTGGNAGDFYGGGIYASAGSTVKLIGTTVNGNTARSGGGIWALDSSLTMTDSVVSQNSATDIGGGLVGSMVTLVDTTVIGNSAYSGGDLLSVGARR